MATRTPARRAETDDQPRHAVCRRTASQRTVGRRRAARCPGRAVYDDRVCRSATTIIGLSRGRAAGACPGNCPPIARLSRFVTWYPAKKVASVVFYELTGLDGRWDPGGSTRARRRSLPSPGIIGRSRRNSDSKRRKCSVAAQHAVVAHDQDDGRDNDRDAHEKAPGGKLTTASSLRVRQVEAVDHRQSQARQRRRPAGITGSA